ncbi:MAG: PKD domain-containing protein [Bacteroidia bacterium]
MKLLYRFAAIIFLAIAPIITIQAQHCDVTIISNKTEVCENEDVQAAATFLDTVQSTFIDDNGQRGNMFDVVAKNDIIVRAFDAHPAGNTNFSMYYRNGSYAGVERDSTKWELIGRVRNVVARTNGTPTRIPFYFTVRIKKGDTVSFYVTSTTSINVNYTNGTTEGDVYASDRNLEMLEGLGVFWPFGGPVTTTGVYRPRIWNGNIIYERDSTRSFTWSTGATGDSVTIVPKGNLKLTVTGTRGGCVAKSDTVLIKQESLNINLGNDTVLCAGTSIQFDLGSLPKGSKIKWKPAGGDRYKLIQGGGEKSVSVTSDIGCVYKDTIQITDKSSPNVDLGSDLDLCQGDSLNIDAGNFGTLAKYSWNVGDTTRAITVKSDGRYVVTVTDSFGCNGKDNIDIALRALPTFSLGKDQEVCEGDDITLNADYSDDNTTYNWNNGANTKELEVTTTDTYKATVTSEYGCVYEDSVHVFFHLAPRSGMDTIQEACRKDEITLDAGDHGPGSIYEWSTSESTREIKVTANGAYTVMITDSFGCTNQETINMTFRKLPSVNLGLDINFCEGDSSTLDAGFDDGYTTYEWSNLETTKTLVVHETGTYSVIVNDSFGCSNTDEIEVLVLDLPKFAWDGDSAICDGETIELDPGNHDKYKWSTNETSRTITVGPGTYSVVITNVFGCTNEEEVDISSVPSAVADFAGNDVGGQKVEFTNSSTNADSYTWDFGDGNTSNDMAPTHWYKEDGTYTVKLTATNRCGNNESSSSVNVTASGIGETGQNVMLVYPNPSSGNLFVSLPESEEKTLIQVFELSGKELNISTFLSTKNTWQINLPATAKGIYALRVTTSTGVATQNFMVE